MTAMWRRYPGRLAHLEGDMHEIVEGGRRVGTRWQALCGRVELRLWWDDRPWMTNYVTREDFDAATERIWCLRCAYLALWALDPPLIALPDWRQFCDQVAAGATLEFRR